MKFFLGFFPDEKSKFRISKVISENTERYLKDNRYL